MNAKKQKLETQLLSADIQSSILKGIAVFVNGYTGASMHFHFVNLAEIECSIYFII